MYPLLTFRRLFVHHLRLSDVAVSRKKSLSVPYPHCFVSLRNQRLEVRILWGVLTCFTQVKASKLLRALGGFFRLVSTIYVVFAVLRFSDQCFQTLPSALSLHTVAPMWPTSWPLEFSDSDRGRRCPSKPANFSAQKSRRILPLLALRFRTKPCSVSTTVNGFRDP